MKRSMWLILVLAIVSCVNNETKPKYVQDNGNENFAEAKNAKQLILEIDLEISKPEDIKLSALNTFLNNGKYIDIHVTQKISTNESAKKIRFELPENITPDNIISISFGPKTIKEVKVNSINLSFGDLNYVINSNQVLDFFKTNKFVDYDEDSKVFKTKRVEGKHNPKLILRDLYMDKIQEVR